MKTVTLCGSMRFAREMQRIAFDLEVRHGFNVLQCVYDPADVVLTDAMLAALSDAHLRKIELSDAVYVVDIGGYTGTSVRREVEYALALGKQVLYHTAFCAAQKPAVDKTFTEC